MDHVISGVAKFQKEVYPNKKATFQKLALLAFLIADGAILP